MKRVRCPKCDNFITFDEKKYTEGQSLVFQCPDCGKQFGIRIGVSKLRNTQKEDVPEDNVEDSECGYIKICFGNRKTFFCPPQDVPHGRGEILLVTACADFPD